MSDIKRFDSTFGSGSGGVAWGEMDEDENGEYVEYEDYLKAITTQQEEIVDITGVKDHFKSLYSSLLDDLTERRKEESSHKAKVEDLEKSCAIRLGLINTTNQQLAKSILQTKVAMALTKKCVEQKRELESRIKALENPSNFILSELFKLSPKEVAKIFEEHRKSELGVLEVKDRLSDEQLNNFKKKWLGQIKKIEDVAPIPIINPDKESEKKD